MGNLQLFDDIPRSYDGPSKYSESHWTFLNRTAKPGGEYIRQAMQSWFDDFEASSDKRQKLLGEFRSDKDAQHLSAFFELFIYHLFKAQGFQIEVEPQWEQGCPDFLLTVPSTGEKVLLEATGTYPERWFGEAKKLEQMVIDYLNDNLNSPDYFVGITIENAPSDYPPYAKMCRYLERQLKLLDYDEVVKSTQAREGLGFGRFPEIRWQHQSWDVNFIIMPKNEARGKPDIRPMGLMFYGAEYVDTTSSIKSRIDSKYGHYGELDIPYLLAVNLVDPYIDDESIIEALFGRQQMTFNFDTRETRHSRAPDGAWYGPHGYQKKRMSGMCVFQGLRPESIHRANPIIWHHPFAHLPLSPELFRLNQQFPKPKENRFEFVQGTPIVDLLKVDANQLPS